MEVENNRVAYLTYDGLTDPLGQSQIMPYIAGLTNEGYRFTVISFEKPEPFSKLETEIRQWCNVNEVQWLPQRYHKRPPVLSTLYDLLVLWFVFKKAHRTTWFSIVHCRSYLTSLIGLKAKQKWRIKFIFDMRGFWADERVEGRLWDIKNPLFRQIYQHFKRKEKQFLERADHIISLTENAKKEIQSWDIVTGPITVIPTCVDLELFDPSKIREEDKLSLRMKLGIKEDDFILLYLGSLGTWYMLNEMLDFFYFLNQKIGSAKFLFVTPDSEHKIREGALAKKVDINRIIVKKAKRDDVPLYISITNCSVLFIKPTFSKRASSPTKLGEVLSMKVLVVANTSVGDNDLLFTSGDIGVLVKNFSTEDYQETVKKLLEFKDKKNENTRNLAIQKLSLAMGVDLYVGVYKGILR